MSSPAFHRLALVATVLALCVLVLGAYVRLSHAGLGCPDWPGCYGLLSVPQTETAIAQASEAYPERPVNAAKAWKEMIHRYFAGTLGLLVLGLAVLAWRHRDLSGQPVALPGFLLVLVIFQALLGMWTVTLLLKPAVVTSHLLGGMATLALLLWLTLRTGTSLRASHVGAVGNLRPLALVALVVAVAQIALGGWTSANYAALACYDFPTCQGQWWPPTDFGEAFTLWRQLGVDYEGGLLGTDARVTIHLTHRLGALVTVLVVGLLAVRMMLNGQDGLTRNLGILVAGVLLAQVGLGIANVVLSLPLPVATAHNAVGALLLLTLVLVNHALRPS